MIDMPVKPGPFTQSFGAIRSLLALHVPAWFEQTREAALARFELVGLPTTKDEEFKYTSLRILHETDYKVAYGATVMRSEIEATRLGKIDAITLTFVNGEYAPELSTEQILPEGVFVGTLQDASESHPGVLAAHLAKIATLENRLGTTNDERFTDLNTAFLGEGALVYVPEGVTLETPVHLQFVSRADHGAFVSYPRVLIALENRAQAKVIETYVGLAGPYFTNTVSETYVGAGAILEHTRLQDESADAIHIASNYVHQRENSVFTSNNIVLGSQIGRVDLNVFSGGEHTETWLNGVYVGLNEQVLDNHTRIDHALPNCNSFEVYKGILGDRAQGVFNGKIFVYEDAQKTDAKQTNQAILLSPAAGVNTKPQLEIFADDVKCTHGATVGQLREDALFYLRARGIPYQEARALLVYAFAAEVLEKVSIEPVRDALEKALFDKLALAEALPKE